MQEHSRQTCLPGMVRSYDHPPFFPPGFLRKNYWICSSRQAYSSRRLSAEGWGAPPFPRLSGRIPAGGMGERARGFLFFLALDMKTPPGLAFPEVFLFFRGKKSRFFGRKTLIFEDPFPRRDARRGAPRFAAGAVRPARQRPARHISGERPGRTEGDRLLPIPEEERTPAAGRQ